MSVIEMAKAHLQNVHARIEELRNQKRILEEEISKLMVYISKGLQDIEEIEAELADNDESEEKVSNK